MFSMLHHLHEYLNNCVSGLANPSEEFMVYYAERMPWCKYFEPQNNVTVVVELYQFALVFFNYSNAFVIR